MKKARLTLTIITLVISILMIPGCSSSNKHPSNYQQLSALIGKSRDEVCAQLGLNDADLEEFGPSEYMTPIQVEYAGVTFDVVLCIHTVDDLLCGFRYIASYEKNPEQAAKDTVTVAKHLSKAMGKTYVKEEVLISEQTESELKELFSGPDSYGNNNFWDLTQNASSEVELYLRHLEKMDYWKQHFEGKPACFYMDFDITYISETDTSNIIISYTPARYRGSGNYKEG